MDYDWLKDNWKSSKPMISSEMMMKIWSGNFKKSFLECLQCDLLVLPPHEFFAIYFMSFSKRWNCTRRRSSCNFSFLKNSLVQISSQLNSKPYDNQYKSKQARRLETQIKLLIDWLIDWNNYCNFFVDVPYGFSLCSKHFISLGRIWGESIHKHIIVHRILYWMERAKKTPPIS